MTKQEFETFLDTKVNETKTPDPINWDLRKQEWLNSLKEFYDMVELWLSDYLATGRIKMERGEVTLQEDHLGTYNAQSRVFTIGMDRVILLPIGTLLIEARGRVDMQGPKGTVRFLLTDKYGSRFSFGVGSDDGNAPVAEPEALGEWVWNIATPPPKIRLIELTAEAFFDALMEVAND